MSSASDYLSENLPPVVITPPGAAKPLYLRYPSYDEWHSLAAAHQALGGKPPEASLVAKTIATCLADESGQPVSDGNTLSTIMKAPPKRIMWLYKKCWETVLKSDEETIAELEKN